MSPARIRSRRFAYLNQSITPDGSNGPANPTPAIGCIRIRACLVGPMPPASRPRSARPATTWSEIAAVGDTAHMAVYVGMPVPCFKSSQAARVRSSAVRRAVISERDPKRHLSDVKWWPAHCQRVRDRSRPQSSPRRCVRECAIYGSIVSPLCRFKALSPKQ